jgi:integrase
MSIERSTDVATDVAGDGRPATVAELATAARRPSTRQAYAAQVRRARSIGLPWPPATDDVAAHVLELVQAGHSRATIDLRINAIRAGLRGRIPGVPPGPPLGDGLDDVLAGARQTAAEPQGAPPLRACHDLAMLEHADTRERCLILTGWVGALRRGELVRLDRSDATRVAEGLEITIRRAKGRRNNAPATEIVCLPVAHRPELCPVRAWEALAAAVGEGAMFRNRRGDRLSGQSVRLVVRRLLDAAGFEPAGYCAHSLRAGSATEAGARGRPLQNVQRHLRHRDLRTTAGYVNRGQLWEQNPVRGLLELAAESLESGGVGSGSALGSDEPSTSTVGGDRGCAPSGEGGADPLAGPGVVPD